MKASRSLGSVLALAAPMTFAAALASCSEDEVQASAECLAHAEGTFDREVRPLLASDQPKTCNQCHLSGVDMTLFVRDTICETRACLYHYGLVDQKNVEQSLVLSWIARAHPDSELITEAVIQRELNGFTSFLRDLTSCSGAACEGITCPTAATTGDKCLREREPDEITPTDQGLGCSSLAIEAAFRDNVYAWRGRCFPCHHSDQTLADPTAPRWLSVEGSCDNGAVQTLRNVIDAGYLDPDVPENSLLIRKPLALVEGGITHGGGEKFHDKRDFAYQSFLSFIQHWASCVKAGKPY